MTEYFPFLHNLQLVILLVVTYIFSINNGRNYSIMATAIMTIIVELASFSAIFYVNKISDLKLLNYLWFNVFAFFDFLLAFGIYYFQRRFALLFSPSAYITIVGYMLLGYLQLITYYDHVHIKSEIVTDFYQWLIPIMANLVLFSQIALMLHRMLFPHPVVKYFARS